VKTLVVPLDESTVAERAVPVAAALASVTDAEVLLLVVDSAHVTPTTDVAYLEEQLQRLPAAVRGRRLLELTDEDVGDAIIESAVAEPDPVIIMGTHAHHGAAALLLGSIADRVLRRSPVPVVLVGPHCETDRVGLGAVVVVAVDGSEQDQRLVDVGCDWALAVRASLVTVHVRVPVGVEAGAILPAGAVAADLAAQRARRAGVDATAITVDAPAVVRGVLDAAVEVGASCVIVGTRRPGALERALLGSTADGLARHARWPIVVVGAQP
jgi:nucleotide-binding universal stress UspA family protein